MEEDRRGGIRVNENSYLHVRVYEGMGTEEESHTDFELGLETTFNIEEGVVTFNNKETDEYLIVNIDAYPCVHVTVEDY